MGAERFLREIETAARLQHPHIVPVLDSGNADGQLFLVMHALEYAPPGTGTGAGFDHVLYAFYQAFLNDTAAAVRTAQTGRSLDPLNVMWSLIESVMLAYARDFDTALPLAVGPIELDPQFPEGYHIAGYVHLDAKSTTARRRSWNVGWN